jgi:hypothetical protein
MSPLNYLHAILHLRPGAQVALVGGLGYENIQWGNETPIPQAELDAVLPDVEKAQANARVLAQITAKERNELLPRSVREFLLEQPGAQGKGWYAKVKGLDDEIVALKATLRT